MANQLDLRRGNNLRGAGSLQRVMNRLFDDIFDPLDGELIGRNMGLSSMYDFIPSYDVEETPDHYIYSLDVPGVNKNDIKIEVLNNNLVVSGERKEEERDKKRRYSERRYGTFQSVFTLPGTIDPSKVEAACENGVLKIAVPKTEEAKARPIPISEGKTGVFQKLAAAGKEAKDKITGKVPVREKTGTEERASTH